MKGIETMFFWWWSQGSSLFALGHKFSSAKAVKAHTIGHKAGVMVPCKASSSALVHVRCAVPDLKATLTQDTSCSVLSVFIHQPPCVVFHSVAFRQGVCALLSLNELKAACEIRMGCSGVWNTCMCLGAGVGSREEKAKLASHSRRLHQPQRYRTASCRLPECSEEHWSHGEGIVFTIMNKQSIIKGLAYLHVCFNATFSEGDPETLRNQVVCVSRLREDGGRHHLPGPIPWGGQTQVRPRTLHAGTARGCWGIQEASMTSDAVNVITLCVVSARHREPFPVRRSDDVKRVSSHMATLFTGK